MTTACSASHFKRYRTTPDNSISTQEQINDKQNQYYNKNENELRLNAQFKSEAQKIGLEAENVNYEIKRNSNNQIGICLLRYPKDAGVWFQANKELAEILKKFCEEPAEPTHLTPEPATPEPSKSIQPVKRISALSTPIAVTDISGSSATHSSPEIHQHRPQSDAIPVTEIRTPIDTSRRRDTANEFPLDAYYLPQRELQAGANLGGLAPPLPPPPFGVQLRHVAPPRHVLPGPAAHPQRRAAAAIRAIKKKPRVAFQREMPHAIPPGEIRAVHEHIDQISRRFSEEIERLGRALAARDKDIDRLQQMPREILAEVHRDLSDQARAWQAQLERHTNLTTPLREEFEQRLRALSTLSTQNAEAITVQLRALDAKLAQLGDSSGQIREVRGRIAELSDKFQKAEGLEERHAAQLQALQREKAELLTELNAKKDELAAAQRAHISKTSRLQGDLRASEEHLAARAEELQNERAGLARLQDKIKGLEDLEPRLQALSEEKLQLETLNQSNAERIAELDEWNKRLIEEFRNHRATVEEVDRKSQALLRGEIENRQRQVEILEPELARTKAELLRLQKENPDLERTLRDEEARANHLQEQLTAASEKKKDLEGKLDESQHKTATLEERLSAQQLNHDSELVLAKDELSRLQEQLTAASGKKKDLEGNLDESRQEVARLKEVDRQFRDEQLKTAALQERLSLQQIDLESLRRELSAERSAKNDLASQLALAKQTLEENDLKIGSLKEKIRALQDQLRAQEETHSQEAERTRSSLSALQDTQRASKEENNRLRQKVGELNDLQRKLDLLTEENAKLNQSLANEALAKKELEAANLRNAKDLAALREEFNRYKETATAQRSKIERERDSFSSLNHDLQEELRKTAEALAKEKERVSQLEQEISQLRSRVAELEQLHKTDQATILRMRQHQQELFDLASKIEQEREALNLKTQQQESSKLEMLESENNGLRQRITLLESNLTQAHQQYDRLQSKAGETQKELLDLQRTIEELRKELERKNQMIADFGQQNRDLNLAQVADKARIEELEKALQADGEKARASLKDAYARYEHLKSIAVVLGKQLRDLRQAIIDRDSELKTWQLRIRKDVENLQRPKEHFDPMTQPAEKEPDLLPPVEAANLPPVVLPQGNVAPYVFYLMALKESLNETSRIGLKAVWSRENKLLRLGSPSERAQEKQKKQEPPKKQKKQKKLSPEEQKKEGKLKKEKQETSRYIIEINKFVNTHSKTESPARVISETEFPLISMFMKELGIKLQELTTTPLKPPQGMEDMQPPEIETMNTERKILTIASFWHCALTTKDIKTTTIETSLKTRANELIKSFTYNRGSHNFQITKTRQVLDESGKAVNFRPFIIEFIKIKELIMILKHRKIDLKGFAITADEFIINNFAQISRILTEMNAQHPSQ